MNRTGILLAVILALALVPGFTATRPARSVSGWLHWRGPQQNSVSSETGLAEKWALGGVNDLWQFDLASGGSPVIANSRVYVMGYQGDGPDLQEVLLCLNAETGKKVWEARFNDFLSDIIYNRYAIGSPCIDAETGNVYALTSAGILSCFTHDGKLLWQHSMMEQFGRLTFPNGRTGGPIIESDLVIVRGITSNWGGEGPAMDRFYAFDKKTGGLVWSSSPGAQPKDNSFAVPVFSSSNGKRVFYTGDGSGNMVCVNARTGAPLWRYPISAGGFNSSVVIHKDKVIGIHNDENVVSSLIGGMVAVRLNASPKPAETGPPMLEREAEVWRNELRAVSCSPVLVRDRVYQVDLTGNLCCVDANTGSVLWKHKLGPDQLHASPLYADGKLYLPLQNGSFFILRPKDDGVEELCKVQLAGRCLGAPAAWNGKVYVTSTEKIHCFGKKGNNANSRAQAGTNISNPVAGPTAALQIIPSEVLLKPGEKLKFTIRGIDANGFVTQSFDSAKAKWAKYIPPTARVRAEMDAQFNEQGELVAGNTASAGAWEATIDDVKGYIRGRVMPAPPIREDFEKFQIAVPHETEQGVKFAYPPLPWIGARFKFEVREMEGNKVLAKTLDNVFFQRATVFIGQPDLKNYTVEADVMTDGNRRLMSTVGLINQRYLISLQGNAQELEVTSNAERIRVTTPFSWQPKVWYHLKTRVDVAQDGSGMVHAKAWKRGDAEPEKWTIEVPHKTAHRNGSPGLFGFAPQSMFRVYIDNISVTPN